MQTVFTTVQKVQEVSALLEIPDSRIIAGGTGFSAESREASRLIDISQLDGMKGIKQKGNRIEIGPLTTLSMLAASPLLKENAPALAEAADAVKDETIRERGTLGGNLADERIGDAAAALLASGAKLTIKTETDFREPGGVHCGIRRVRARGLRARRFDLSVDFRRFALCNEGNVGGRETIDANGRRPLRDIVRPINDFFRRRCSLHNNVASNPGIGYFYIFKMSNYLFHVMLKQRFWRGIDF